MPIVTPTEQDVEKIHAEILSYVTARSAVTLAIITTFGFVLAGFFQVISLPDRVVLSATCAVAGLLVYSVLCLLAEMLLGDLQVLAQYLRVTKTSIWEEHSWELYGGAGRTKNYWQTGIGRQVKLTAAVVAALTCIIPVIIAMLSLTNHENSSECSEPSGTATMTALLVLVAVGTIFFRMFISEKPSPFYRWFCRPEEYWKEEWERIVQAKNTQLNNGRQHRRPVVAVSGCRRRRQEVARTIRRRKPTSGG